MPKKQKAIVDSRERFARFSVSPKVPEKLSQPEREIILLAADEPLHFIDNEAFHSTNAEREVTAPIDGLDVREKFVLWREKNPAKGSRHEKHADTLTVEQEKRLFLQYNFCRFRYCSCVLGLKAKSVTNIKTARAIIFWFRKAINLRDFIVGSNMPLVLFMAKKMTDKGSGEFSELVSEGSIALLRSVEKFDVARGFKFSTYACRAIFKSFSRLLAGQNKYRGRFPSEYDPKMEKGDYLERKREEDLSDSVDKLVAILKSGSAELTPAEERVIRLRFDLDRIGSKTLDAVGKIIGVTKERIRQIQIKAIEKIRLTLIPKL